MHGLALLVVCVAAAGCDRAFGVEFRASDAAVDAVSADADTSGCLRDTFHDNAIDLLKWYVADPDNTPISVLERDERLIVSLAPAPDPTMYTSNALASARRYDMTGGYVIVEVIQAVVAGGAENFLVLQAEYTAGGLNQYSINVGGGGTLGFAMWVDNARTIATRPYTVEDRFWRIGHHVETNEVHLQVSPDKVTWSEPVVYAAQVPVTNLLVALGGGTFQIRNPDPGAAIFDNLQLVTAGCPYLE